MKKLSVIIMALLLSISSGCALLTPEGYDSDTTPAHDGENWRGGL